MKESISLKKIFDIDDMIFHPAVFYPGEFVLGCYNFFETIDVLSYNQIGDRYDKFINKYYTAPLYDIFHVQGTYISIPRICSSVDVKTNKRELFFNIDNFCACLINTLLLINPEEKKDWAFKNAEMDNNEKIKFLGDILKEQCRRYNEVIVEKEGSKYYSLAKERYEFYCNTTPNSRLGIIEFYKRYKRDISSIRSNLMKVIPFFSRKINCEEFIDCFDYDKLSLLVASSALDGAVMVEKYSNTIGYSFNYVYYYVQSVERIRKKKKNYNKKVTITDYETSKLKIITTNDILEKFYELKKKYCTSPIDDLRITDLDDILKSFGYEDIDLSTQSGYEVLSKIVKKIKEDKELAAEWEFIPNTKTNSKDTVGSNHRCSQESYDSDLLSKKSEFMSKCKDFLENTKYLYKIHGKNSFSGYTGYIYPNGKVIFEKEKFSNSTQGNATYVMEYQTFLYNSKLNKKLLVSKIRNGEITDVQRIFHKIDDFEIWKSKISQLIAGYEYTSQVISYIDMMLASSTITNSKSKELKK